MLFTYSGMLSRCGNTTSYCRQKSHPRRTSPPGGWHVERDEGKERIRVVGWLRICFLYESCHWMCVDFFSAGFLQDNLPFRHIIERGVYVNSLVHHMKMKKKKRGRSHHIRRGSLYFVCFLYLATESQTVRYSAAGKRVKNWKKGNEKNLHAHARARGEELHSAAAHASLSQHPSLTEIWLFFIFSPLFFRCGLPSNIACFSVCFSSLWDLFHQEKKKKNPVLSVK